MYTLCVIDMQNYFEAAKEKEICNNVKLEIIKAKNKNYPIVYVKYDLTPWSASKKESSIVDGLCSITRFYKRKYTLTKKQDDGGLEIHNFLKKHKLPNNVRITGVNSCACVLYTVETLSERFSTKINVIKNAINCNDTQECHAIRCMRQLKHVRII